MMTEIVMMLGLMLALAAMAAVGMGFILLIGRMTQKKPTVVSPMQQKPQI